MCTPIPTYLKYKLKHFLFSNVQQAWWFLNYSFNWYCTKNINALDTIGNYSTYVLLSNKQERAVNTMWEMASSLSHVVFRKEVISHSQARSFLLWVWKGTNLCNDGIIIFLERWWTIESKSSQICYFLTCWVKPSEKNWSLTTTKHVQCILNRWTIKLMDLIQKRYQ